MRASPSGLRAVQVFDLDFASVIRFANQPHWKNAGEFLVYGQVILMQKGERRFSINRKLTSIFPVRLVREANDGGDQPESRPNARKMRFVKIHGDSRFIFFIGPKKPTSLGFPYFP